MNKFYTVYTYDIEKYPFQEVMKEILGVDNLDLIHEEATWPLLTREKDQSTPYHRLYYSRYKENMQELWARFTEEVIAPLFNEYIYYQTIPTFRVQIPNNVGVGEYHTDAEYGHTDGARNVFLPMVDVNQHNTIWSESAPGKEDYTPMELKYGQFALWDGVNLKHGNKSNNSNVTRVSIDARVLPCSLYDEKTANSSINLKVKFGPGAYYSEGAV